MLDLLRTKVSKANLVNVVPLLTTESDAKLRARSSTSC